jgi:hypothetical protein
VVASDVIGFSDATDTMDATDATGVTDTTDTTSVIDVADATATTGATDATDATDATGVTGVIGVTDSTDSTDAAGRRPADIVCGNVGDSNGSDTPSSRRRGYWTAHTVTLCPFFVGAFDYDSLFT